MVIDKIQPIPSNGKFSPTVIDKALANGTNTIRSRCLVTIVNHLAVGDSANFEGTLHF